MVVLYKGDKMEVEELRKKISKRLFKYEDWINPKEIDDILEEALRK